MGTTGRVDSFMKDYAKEEDPVVVVEKSLMATWNTHTGKEFLKKILESVTESKWVYGATGFWRGGNPEGERIYKPGIDCTWLEVLKENMPKKREPETGGSAAVLKLVEEWERKISSGSKPASGSLYKSIASSGKDLENLLARMHSYTGGDPPPPKMSFSSATGPKVERRINQPGNLILRYESGMQVIKQPGNLVITGRRGSKYIKNYGGSVVQGNVIANGNLITIDGETLNLDALN